MVDAAWVRSAKEAKDRGKASVGIASSSVRCGICFGAVKTGTPFVHCGCGKEYHRSCAERVGECPGCGFDMEEWLSEDDTDGNKVPFDPENVYIPGPRDKKRPFDLSLPPVIYIDTGNVKKKLPIDEIFLMTSYGLLIEHYSFDRKTALDEEILASMLTAVTDFLSDAMGDPYKKGDRKKQLKNIAFGDITLLFGIGKVITIVGMVSGTGNEDVQRQLQEAVNRIEDRHMDVLRGWDGEVKKLDGVKRYMEELVLGKYA